jgi:rod shape-determining protein MreD
MNNFLIILSSFVITLLITTTTFVLGEFSPDWIQLVLIYWLLAVPSVIGLISSWLIGLIADVTLGSTLGMHALTYTGISFIIIKSYKFLRYLTVYQQAIIIFIILILKYTILLWIDKLLDINVYTLSIYWTPLMSAILWPIVFHILRFIRRKYYIAE